MSESYKFWTKEKKHLILLFLLLLMSSKSWSKIKSTKDIRLLDNKLGKVTWQSLVMQGYQLKTRI